jgi:hypothetical protein
VAEFLSEVFSEDEKPSFGDGEADAGEEEDEGKSAGEPV